MELLYNGLRARLCLWPGTVTSRSLWHISPKCWKKCGSSDDSFSLSLSCCFPHGISCLSAAIRFVFSISGMPIMTKGSVLACRLYLVCSPRIPYVVTPYLIVPAQTGRYLIGESVTTFILAIRRGGRDTEMHSCVGTLALTVPSRCHLRRPIASCHQGKGE